MLTTCRITDDSQVFEFLVQFPAHNSIRALVSSNDTPLEVVFPPSAPFKALYSVHTLRQCLEFQTQHVGYLPI